MHRDVSQDASSGARCFDSPVKLSAYLTGATQKVGYYDLPNGCSSNLRCAVQIGAIYTSTQDRDDAPGGLLTVGRLPNGRDGFKRSGSRRWPPVAGSPEGPDAEGAGAASSRGGKRAQPDDR
jgi:hypothetical protein